MSGWRLGIDFGTSYTVAGAAMDGAASVIDIESSGRARIPSSVFLTEDGDILVGSAAQHQAVFAPERFEPTPKRSLGAGSLFLGDRLVPVAELVAAVLRRVYTEACRQQGERTPDAVVVTHPAEWGETRLAVLRESVDTAELPHVEYMAEPVAAAARIAFGRTEPGQLIAVYDFGGGTFDAAVLRRTLTGFEVAGPPAGRDPLGGEDIDDAIIDYLGSVLSDENPDAWATLRNPSDGSARRDAAALRSEVQRAKETLSETNACQLWVPGIGRDVQLTRPELDGLIGATVDDTVATLENAIRDAGITADALAGIYLVGGSSRIPLVAETIWRRLGVQPSVQDNPKSVVALGAAAWDPNSGNTAPAVARRESVVPPSFTSTMFRTFLAMSAEHTAWPAGTDCSAHYVFDSLGGLPLTIRARDEPTQLADSDVLSRQVLAARAPRTPGFRETAHGPAAVLGLAGTECTFVMQSAAGNVTMVEQYLVDRGRAIVIAGPEQTRDLIGSMTLEPPQLAPDAWFESRLSCVLPPEWEATEQVFLQRRGSGQVVTSRRKSAPAGMSFAQWREEQLTSALAVAGSSVLSEVGGRVFNQLDGGIITIGRQETSTYTITKIGLACLSGHGVAVEITIPHADQGLFPALARHAWLHPNVGRSD